MPAERTYVFEQAIGAVRPCGVVSGDAITTLSSPLLISLIRS